jgi:hypothetical protein
MTYPRTGRTADQVSTLRQSGVLGELGDLVDLEAKPQVDGDAPIEQRVRAYLHTNCASCHLPGGPARGDLDLSWWAEDWLASVCDVEPMLGDLGVDQARLVAPGEPGRSLIWERMRRRDAYAMPPLGSNLVDEQGSLLLRQWIEGGACDDVPGAGGD